MNEEYNVFQNYNRIKEEMKKEMNLKNVENANWDVIAKSLNLEPCNLHIIKKGKTCRKCKKIQETIETIKTNSKIIPEKITIKKNKYKSVQQTLKDFNSLLKENIIEDDFFIKRIDSCKKYKEVLKTLKKYHDSFSPWKNLKKGTPSIFWSCLYKFIIMEVDLEKVVKQIKKLPKSYKLIFLFIYLRFVLNENELFEIFRTFFVLDKIISYRNKKYSIKRFLIYLIHTYKFEGIILPQFDLITARKINMILLKEPENNN